MTAPTGGCPCLYVEPCSPLCSCANPGQSGGCERCCRYGSLEQRTAHAESLAALHAGKAEGGRVLEELRKAAQAASDCLAANDVHQGCVARLRATLARVPAEPSTGRLVKDPTELTGHWPEGEDFGKFLEAATGEPSAEKEAQT